MIIAEAMAELESLGTEQVRLTYRRHGAAEPLFGVSYAGLKLLKKRIKVDQELAEGLWATGNHDARVLTTMIADPKSVAPSTLDAWAADLTNHVLADAVAGVVAETPRAIEVIERWTRSDGEWIASAGWSALAHLAAKGETLPDAYLRERLDTIERSIASAKNRVRHAMNGALIAMAIQSAEIKELAIATATRIGKVTVDHGDTGCKTPDAVAYIHKTAERAASR